MATVEFRYDPKNTAWFTANAAMVLKAGEPAYHDTTGLFKLGDGVTALSALSFLPTVSASTPTIQQVLTAGQVATTTIETTGFIKTGGLSTQFLKADGTVDSTVYGVGNALTSNPLSQFAATTSAQLAGVISDETGTGALVFGTSPSFTTGITTPLINGTSGTLQIGTTDLVNIGNKTTTSQRLVRIGQGTAWMDLGNMPVSTSNPAIWFNTTTPSDSNYTLALVGSEVTLNTPNGGGIRLRHNNTSAGLINWNSWNPTPIAVTFGAYIPFEITIPTNTAQTLGTNIPNFKVTGSNKQWATGTVPLQYFNHLTANTVSAVGASTFTNVYGLFVEASTAGTNATITNNWGIGTNSAYVAGRLVVGVQLATSPYGNSIVVVPNTVEGIVVNRRNSVTACLALGSDASSNATLNVTNADYIFNISTVEKLRLSSTNLLTFADTVNMVFNTTTGSKIGTATTQKLSFWNATPIVQPTTAVAAATVVSGTGGNVKHDDTFDGYTVEKVVRALRNIGLLA